MTYILAFVFVLGVLVFVHESGHFLIAKWVGVKVKVFSLGFPPKIVGRTWGDTEYRIGALPLGGYVKMAGDNPMEATGNPEEFMSCSKWERLAILLAGPAMNIVLSILILTALFMVGVERPAGLDDPVDIRFVAEDSPASRGGVQPGDRITRIDGDPVASWKAALDKFIVSANDTLMLSVERDGQTIEMPIEIEARGDEEIGYAGLFPAIQPQVAALFEDFPAERAGMREGDIITKVGGQPIYHFTELIEGIEARQGEPVTLGVLRDQESMEFTLTPQQDDGRWLIGINFNATPTVLFRVTNPALALSEALAETSRFTRLTFIVLGRLVTGRASLNTLSGPVGIGVAAGETARRGAGQLFMFMAFLSLNLGILNLLPIPLLDGGHMAVIALEGLAGRDFSLQVKERIMQVGFVMLLLLMVTVLAVDLSKIDAIGKYLPW